MCTLSRLGAPQRLTAQHGLAKGPCGFDEEGNGERRERPARAGRQWLGDNGYLQLLTVQMEQRNDRRDALSGAILLAIVLVGSALVSRRRDRRLS